MTEYPNPPNIYPSDPQPETPPEMPPTPPSVEPPADLTHLDTPANLIIAGSVAAAAGIGWAPAFIDTAWLIASNAAMVSSLAFVYQYKWTGEHVREFISRLIQDSGITFASVAGLAKIMKLTGIGFLPGVVINGTMNAIITLAIGKSAQHYFKNRGQVPDDELIKFFRESMGRSNPFKGGESGGETGS